MNCCVSLLHAGPSSGDRLQEKESIRILTHLPQEGPQKADQSSKDSRSPASFVLQKLMIRYSSLVFSQACPDDSFCFVKILKPCRSHSTALTNPGWGRQGFLPALSSPDMSLILFIYWKSSDAAQVKIHHSRLTKFKLHRQSFTYHFTDSLSNPLPDTNLHTPNSVSAKLIHSLEKKLDPSPLRFCSCKFPPKALSLIFPPSQSNLFFKTEIDVC